MPKHITEYILYKWRYSIGYAAVGLLVCFLLIAAVLYVPGGLRPAEIASTVKSNSLSFNSFDPQSVINLPYSILQYLSFLAFGVTAISIKLPSLILGLLSVIGIVLLLRHWFHMNVAVIATLIVITASQFIFASQDGTPTIMYIFMPTWLLYLALKVSRQTEGRSFWEILLLATIAISLYTPLSVYIIVALISATFLHPHLRYIVRQLSTRKIIVAIFTGVLLLTPLILALISDPKIGLQLLGIPQEWPDLGANIMEVAKTHFGFFFPEKETAHQSVYTLPSLLLVLLGGLHLFKTRHTARSYIITGWFILLAPIILFNPEATAITFVPVLLLIAAGFDELLVSWYRMFPRNPYARVAGLFPIILLVVGMALTGTERYFYTYRYSPDVANNFSDDLELLSNELSSLDVEPIALFTTQAELPFYEAVADHNSIIRVIPPEQALPTDEQFIITRDAFYERDLSNREPSKIITNGKTSKADRLYLYKTVQK